MEVGGVKLCLENAIQCDAVMGIDHDDRISVTIVMRRVQGGLGICEDRTAELKCIGRRMEVRDRGLADAIEIEDKIVARSRTAQNLVRTARNDRLGRGLTAAAHRRIDDQRTAIAIVLDSEIRQLIAAGEVDAVQRLAGRIV